MILSDADAIYYAKIFTIGQCETDTISFVSSALVMLKILCHNSWQYQASLELSKHGFVTVPSFLVQVCLFRILLLGCQIPKVKDSISSCHSFFFSLPYTIHLYVQYHLLLRTEYSVRKSKQTKIVCPSNCFFLIKYLFLCKSALAD